MKKEIKIPPIGESITEATIGEWKKNDGEYVEQNEVILVVESDKAAVDIAAEVAGVVKRQAEKGVTLPIGSVIGYIDTDAKPSVQKQKETTSATSKSHAEPGLSPATRRAAQESGVDTSKVIGTGKEGRLTKKDIEASGSHSSPTKATAIPPKAPTSDAPGTRREPMSPLRKRIAERLVEAQHTAAILTTFNEVDLTLVNALRQKYKEKFKEKYGVRLGYMGFFVKAVTESLKEYPRVNAFIDGTDIVYNEGHHVGVAVGTEKGLIVPVIRNAQDLSIPEIEIAIEKLAEKARLGKISVDDLKGGTFTVSNGGVYGSLLSTPILNPPQSGILGMHKMMDRPVAIQGKVEIRPMMYIAFSYDHRIIDGKEAVGFLVKVKEDIENPEKLFLSL